MRIAIATHVFNHVDFEVYFNHLYCVSNWAKKYDLVFVGKCGLQAATARNSIIEKSIELQCTHVFFLDGDHVIPVETLDYLVENADKAMVSGLVCKKGEGFKQVNWEIKNTDKGQMYYHVTLPIDGRVYETSVCAFGCTLINLEKIQKLDKPYFRDTCKESNGEFINIRSDVNLCTSFIGIGERIYVDTRVLVGHLGQKLLVYPQNADDYKRAIELSNKTVLLREGQVGKYFSAGDLSSE
jgi:hypothetical protein